LQNSTRHWFFTVDKSLRLTSLDTRLGNLLGERLPEALGAPYYEFLPRIGHGDVDLIADALGSGEPEVLREFHCNCFHGGTDADICIQIQKDDAANVTGALVMARLHPLCEHFNGLESCRQIVEINKTSTMLGHGIKNPLHTIKGVLFLLQLRCGEQEEVVQLANLASGEIARIDGLITRFLGASRCELVLHEEDINSILKELEAFINLQAVTSNVDFMTEYGEVPPVLVDHFYIEQALYNVFRNALEAMPQGGTLIVETSSGEYSGRKCALVEVTDTGRGMSKRQIHALLSGQKQGGGRGNGLPITLDIVRRHGGQMTIKSKMGVGTTVCLSVPVDRE